MDKMELFLRSLTFLLALSTSWAACSCNKPSILKQISYTLSGWDLEFPCENTKNFYTKSGRYIPRNVIPTKIQIYNDEAILAMPRYKPGVPFTLGIISLKDKSCTPSIVPFPCWPIQEEGNPAALQSVVDIALEHTGQRIWALDTGIANTLEQPVRRASPKVVGIDLKSGKIIKVVDLSSLTCSTSQLQSLVIDATPEGQLYMYIGDASTRAIIVYEATGDRGFRVRLPAAVNLGSTKSDLLFMQLVQKSHGSKVLYFTYLGSSRMFSINAENLRKGSACGAIVDVGPKQNKILLLGTDNGSSIFFRNKGQSDIYMWNTDSPFTPENYILVQKGNECRMPTAVAPGKRLMYVLESNFHHYAQNTVGCTGPSVSLHPIVKSCED